VIAVEPLPIFFSNILTFAKFVLAAVWKTEIQHRSCLVMTFSSSLTCYDCFVYRLNVKLHLAVLKVWGKNWEKLPENFHEKLHYFDKISVVKRLQEIYLKTSTSDADCLNVVSVRMTSQLSNFCLSRLDENISWNFTWNFSLNIYNV